jgi:hypothetical protein
MLNNGTNRLWQPARQDLFVPKPTEQWDVTIQHNGIHVAFLVDDAPVMAPKVLTAEQAAQIGTRLLQAGAIHGFMQMQSAARAAAPTR